MSELIIADVAIRQDSQNRYCLNDLHKAAGDEKKHQPANWLRANQTKALIEEIARFSEMRTDHSSEMRTAVNVINGGDNRGTYVVKELVYSYAMWISASFHLHVIRAYDALVTNQTFDFLKPISEPLSIADFEWRHQVISNALNNLKNAQVIIKLSGAEFLAGK